MRKRKIKWYSRKQCMQQEFYSGLEFAFVSDNNEQCTPFVLCKDFLQDAIQAHLINERRSIYKFSYDPKLDPPLSTTKTRLLVACCTDPGFKNKVINCIDFVNQIEKKLKLVATTYRECEGPPPKYRGCGVWYLEGSKRWMKSPPMISFYTLIIRIGMSHTKGIPFEETLNLVQNGSINAYQYGDKNRLKRSRKGIERILKYGDRRIFGTGFNENYAKKVQTNVMHNECGICGFSEKYGRIADFFPQWFKETS